MIQFVEPSVREIILILSFGLIAGVRHGIDVDHIAAITDIVGSQASRTHGFVYATFYALGHGVMVIMLGVFVLFVGQALPESVDRIFEHIVGVTLVLLGLYVLWSILRQGERFTMKSRWMLIFDAIQFGYHKLLHNFNLSHRHPRVKEGSFETKTAFGIGLIHGFGAETPTQIAALTALVGIGGGLKGALFLFLFVIGIFISNLAVAIFSSLGYSKVKKARRLYLAFGLLTSVLSVIVGINFLKS